MIPRDRMLALQMAAQVAGAGKNATGKTQKKKLSETEAAVQSAMSGKGIAAKTADKEE